MTTAVLRWVSGFFITGAVPCEIVERTDKFVALFQAPGSVWKRESGDRSGPRGRNMLPAGRDGGHSDTVWTGDGVVRVHVFGEEWSVWRWLSADGTWSDYMYVNFEDPWRPSPVGYDSGDWVLDIVCNSTSWTYKDEDELQWAQDVGLVDAHWVARTRGAGRRASQAIEANAWPFNEDWDRWLPSDRATRSALPNDWDAVEMPGTGV